MDRRVGVESRKFRAILQVPEAETTVIGSGKGTMPVRGHCYRHDRVLMALDWAKFQPALQVPWRVARVLVTGEMVEVLVGQGDVDDANSSDLDCVGKAISAAARRGLDLT